MHFSLSAKISILHSNVGDFDVRIEQCMVHKS